MKKETIDIRKEIDNQLIRLDEAIKKGKSKWIEEDIIELLATTSLIAKTENIGRSQSMIHKADNLLGKWYFQKSKNKPKYLNVNKLYKAWSKEYDNPTNIAIFLEEKITKKMFNYKNKDILDLGCGTGRYAIPLARRNNVVCMDFSKDMLKVARKKAKESKVKINFKEGDITKFKSKNKFDVIISMLVQDHIKDLKKMVNTLNSLSKIGTEIIISNIHPYHTYKAHKKDNKAQLFSRLSTDQFYHPLEEYLKLFRDKGFELTGYNDLILEEKYSKLKEFNETIYLTNKPIVVVMKFKKVR